MRMQLYYIGNSFSCLTISFRLGIQNCSIVTSPTANGLNFIMIFQLYLILLLKLISYASALLDIDNDDAFLPSNWQYLGAQSVQTEGH